VPAGPGQPLGEGGAGAGQALPSTPLRHSAVHQFLQAGTVLIALKQEM
jgi:hypothetical protein